MYRNRRPLSSTDFNSPISSGPNAGVSPVIGFLGKPRAHHWQQCQTEQPQTYGLLLAFGGWGALPHKLITLI